MSSRFNITVISKVKPKTDSNDSTIEVTEETLPLPTTVDGWVMWIDYIICAMFKDYVNPNVGTDVNYTFTPHGSDMLVRVINPWHSIYISNLNDDILVSILLYKNTNIQSSLYNTLVNECNIDKGFVLKQAFVSSMRSKFISADGTPDWLLGLFGNVVDDLLGVTLDNKFVITHSMIATGMRELFKSIGCDSKEEKETQRRSSEEYIDGQV